MRTSEGSTRETKPAKGMSRGAGKPVVWRFGSQCTEIAAGHNLKIEVDAPAMIHWSDNGWSTTYDVATRECSGSKHEVELPTATLAPGTGVVFTFYWKDAAHWEGRDFLVMVAAPSGGSGFNGRIQ